VFTTVHHVTERKFAQLPLEESRGELRRLSEPPVQAREQGRGHLALERHDGLGQRFTLLKIELELEPAAGEMQQARQERSAGAASAQCRAGGGPSA